MKPNRTTIVSVPKILSDTHTSHKASMPVPQYYCGCGDAYLFSLCNHIGDIRMPNKTRVQIAKTALFGTSDIVVDKTQGYATSIPIGIDEVPFGVPLFTRAMHGDALAWRS